MAPTAIVVAAVGYFCWPYLSPSGANVIVDAGGKPVDISMALLSPKITAAPGRDPFGMKVETPRAEAEPEEDPEPNPRETSLSTKTASVTPTKSGSTPRPNTNPARGTPEGAATPVETAEVEVDQPLTGLALNATFLRGSRRAAMINSQFYSEGETLEPSGPNIKPYVVAKIFQHHVLLERQGRTVELTYPSPPPNPDLESSKSVAKGGQKPPIPKTGGRPT